MELKLKLGFCVVFVLCVCPIYCQRHLLQQILNGQQKLADACTYLSSRMSIFGRGNAQFQLTLNGYHGNQVRSESPIEVSIKPLSPYLPDNFTDFIIYAQPTAPVGMPQMGMHPMYLGVFKIYPRFAAGARGFTCDPRAMGFDAFGSVDERNILIKRAMDPNNSYWYRRQPIVRQYASVLWYPTEMAMNTPSLHFVAKIKSDGHWYVLQSKNLVPYIPPDPMSTMYDNLERMSSFTQDMRQFERQADAATAGL